MNPFGLLGLVAMLIVLALLVARLARKAGATAVREPVWPYRKKSPLLSPVEQRLHTRLTEALPDHLILAQVSLAQVVDVTAVGAEHQRWFNKVSQKSLDFLVCTPDFTLVAAIELDDATHGRTRQQRRDADKDRVLQAAGLPLVRWRAGKLPDGAEIRLKVLGSALLAPEPSVALVTA